MPVIGILSDAHGNIAAFRSAIGHLERLGAREFLFLGDSLGYIPSVAVTQELLDMGDRVNCILGNHERKVLGQGVDAAREPLYQHQAIRERLSPELCAFVRTWPTHQRRTFGPSSVLFVHGSPLDYSEEYVYPDSDLERFAVREDFVFMGHTHYPFIRKRGGTTFVNVGSCGLPRDDGRYGSCAAFDPETGTASIHRYAIALPETAAGELHSSVLQLFSRRAASLVGDVLAG